MSELVEGVDNLIRRGGSIDNDANESSADDSIVKLGGSFDNHGTVQDDNSDDDDDDDIVDIDVITTDGSMDHVIKKVPQRMFLTRRLSGMPVLPASSFDSLDKPTTENNIDDDVIVKLTELINSMPNTPSINHHATASSPNTITSTAVKAVSVGWSGIRGFASNFMGNGSKKG